MIKLIIGLLLISSTAFCETREMTTLYQTDRMVHLETPKVASINVRLDVKVGSNVYRHKLVLPVGFTVAQAIDAVYEVGYGEVCLDPNGIVAINGLHQTEKHFWSFSVNGNYQNYSSHSSLSPGDVLEVVYSDETVHVSLESWLLAYEEGI